jgi:hypothetical protein
MVFQDVLIKFYFVTLEIMGVIRNTYRILFGKSERKTPFIRPIHKYKDNIKLYLK